MAPAPEALMALLDGGALDEVESLLPPGATASARDLLAYLATSGRGWEAVEEWRMQVRTEAYRRTLAAPART